MWHLYVTNINSKWLSLWLFLEYICNVCCQVWLGIREVLKFLILYLPWDFSKRGCPFVRSKVSCLPSLKKTDQAIFGIARGVKQMFVISSYGITCVWMNLNCKDENCSECRFRGGRVNSSLSSLVTSLIYMTILSTNILI